MAVDPKQPQVGDQIELKAPWGLVEVTEISASRVKFKLTEANAIQASLDELRAKAGGVLPPRIAALENPPLSIKRKHWCSKIEPDGAHVGAS